jgi:uncharacterized protein
MAGGQLIDKKIDIRVALAISLAWLLICDSLLFKTAGWSRLGLSAFAYAGLFIIFWISGLKVSDVGLAKNRIKYGFLLAFKIIAIYSLVLLAAFLIGHSLFKDPRYHHSVLTALTSAFFILPLKTVVFEELAFRGLIPALVEKWKNKSVAIWFSSALFGLWHMTTALDTRSDLTYHNLTLPSYLILIIIFLATSTAGYFLVYLRYRSDSLVTPIFLHWFINASAVILAAISWSHSI